MTEIESEATVLMRWADRKSTPNRIGKLYSDGEKLVKFGPDGVETLARWISAHIAIVLIPNGISSRSMLLHFPGKGVASVGLIHLALTAVRSKSDAPMLVLRMNNADTQVSSAVRKRASEAWTYQKLGLRTKCKLVEKTVACSVVPDSGTAWQQPVPVSDRILVALEWSGLDTDNIVLAVDEGNEPLMPATLAQFSKSELRNIGSDGLVVKNGKFTLLPWHQNWEDPLPIFFNEEWYRLPKTDGGLVYVL